MDMTQQCNLRIKPHFSIIAHSADTVELRSGVWNATSFTFTDASGSGHLFALVDGLDGSLSTAELAKQHGVPRSEVEGLIDHLSQVGVLETGSSSALDHYLENCCPSFVRRPSRSGGPRPVVLLGDDDLTSEIAKLLGERTGTGQPLRPRADDPRVALLLAQDTSWTDDGAQFLERGKVFAEWRQHFVVFATKVIDPLRFRLLNRVCLEHSIPWLHVAMDGPFLLIGPTFLPNQGACYECLETSVTMNLRESESYARYKRALVAGGIKHRPLPIQPAISSLLAAHACLETLNFVLTGNAFTSSKVLSIYLPTMEFSFNEVLRTSGCPACGPVPERDDTELYFDVRALLDGADVRTK
jgi:bacteriocin biosynthesis cyclodehydratase domain-containing protein